MHHQEKKQGIRLIKPAIVAHCNPDKDKTRNSIYSCDIQKGGGRIATGGGDSFVKVWKLSALLGTPDQCDGALQASLCNHTKSVNVVRWSKDGQFLASGSDDCYILVYKLDDSGHMTSQPFGSNSAPNKECWARCLTLHGHTMDVLDLDWSPRGLIASASIDNKIMIWDLTAHFSPPQGSTLPKVASPFRVLDSHRSFVKGISFDPVGSFLASCSADNVVMIWSVDTWTAAATLSEPMAESVDRTIFRRMSWAPDGGSLCLSSATKAAKPVGMVLQRDTWSCLADLVGHEAQSTCCRFAPYLKVAERRKRSSAGQGGSPPTSSSSSSSSSVKKVPCTIVALGDHQGIVSVWSTVQNTPLLVLRELFAGPVLDMAWTSLPGDLASNAPSAAQSSMTGGAGAVDLLVCSSLDGTLALAMFDSGSLSGKHERVMTTEEQEAHFRKMYGRAQSELLDTPEPLLEGPSVLRYREALKRDSGHPSSSSSSSVSNINSSNSCSSSTGVLKPSDLMSGGSVGSSSVRNGTSHPLLARQAQTYPAQQQRVTVLKSGKKRIQPMLLNSSSSGSGSSGNGVTNGGGGDSVHLPPGASTPVTRQLGSAPNFASSRSLMQQLQGHADAASTSSGFAPSQHASHDASDTSAKRPKVAHLSGCGVPLKSTGRVVSLCFQQNSFICRSAQLAGGTGEGSVVIAEVKARAPPAAEGGGGRGGLSSLLFGASEPLAASSPVVAVKARHVPCPNQLGRVRHFSRVLSHLTAYTTPRTGSTEQVIAWETYINGEVTVMSALHADTAAHPVTSLSSSADGMCVAGSSDGALHLLSLESGLRLSPVFVIGAPAISVDLVALKAGVSRMLVVAADGDVLIYDLLHTVPSKANTQLSFVLKTSLRPLLVSMRCGLAAPAEGSAATQDQSQDQDLDLEVQRAYLSGTGAAVVSVRAQKQVLGGAWQTFQFCQHTQLWMRVADMRNLLSGVFMGALSSPPLLPGDPSALSTPSLDELAREAVRGNDLSLSDVLAVSRASSSQSGGGAQDMASFTSQITLSHIEERLATSFALQSTAEARLWLTEWTTFCCRHSLHKKVRWLVNRLVMACRSRVGPPSPSSSSSSHHLFSSSCSLGSWAWLDTSFPDLQPGVTKLDLLRDTVLPAISRSDTSQALLIEITDVLEMMAAR